MSTMNAAERLKTAVDDALPLVKEKYGPAEADWTVEVVADDKGRNFAARKNADTVRVQLDPDSDDDLLRMHALHECVHVLNPPELDSNERSHLEEAAAVLISLDPNVHGNPGWVEHQKQQLYSDGRPDQKQYADAAKALEKITDKPLDLIRSLRGENGRSLTRDVTPAELISHEVDEATAKWLCDRFSS
jgi:hypothetical protein